MIFTCSHCQDFHLASDQKLMKFRSILESKIRENSMKNQWKNTHQIGIRFFIDLGAIWELFGQLFGSIWLYWGSFGPPKTPRMAHQDSQKCHLIPMLVPRGDLDPIFDGFWQDLEAQMAPKLLPEELWTPPEPLQNLPQNPLSTQHSEWCLTPYPLPYYQARRDGRSH